VSTSDSARLTSVWALSEPGRPVLSNGNRSSPRPSATIFFASVSASPVSSARLLGGRTGPEAEISPASRSSWREPWYQVTLTAP